ncbi:MAG: hypothetical protein QM758_03385 [Armatimonas sp.]
MRWLRARKEGDINEDPELQPRRSQASVFFLTGIALVVLALIVMSVIGAVMQHKEQQAPVEGKTAVTEAAHAN